VQHVVNPPGQRRVDEVAKRKQIKFRILLKLTSKLRLLVVVIVEEVKSGRRDVSPGADTSDLRAQVVGLGARERRIAHNLSQNIGPIIYSL